MAGLPWGDKPQHGRVAGGNPPMRPDQRQLPTSRAGTGPAPQSNVITARQIIIIGPGGGEFFYNAAGTVLLYSNVAVATTDPKLHQAVLAGTTWYQSGGVININNGTLLVYSPTAGAGKMAESIAPGPGSDTFGNAFLGGHTTYGAAGGGFIATQMLAGGILFYSAGTEAGPWTLQSNLASDFSGNAGDLGIIATGNVKIQGPTQVAGSLAAQSLAASEGSASGKVLQVTNTTAAPSASTVQFQAAAAADNVQGIQVAGDTSNRFVIDSNGSMNWGTGTAARDIALSRVAAGVLGVTGPIEAIVGGVPETFHNLGAPIAGWTVGTARYKLLSDSGLVLVQIANLAPPGAPPADGTVIFTAANGFPAGYQTSSIQRMPAQSSAGGGTEQAGLLFNTDGSIQVFGVGGTTINRLDGTFILSTL
jgi:hypothetical protein